MQNIITPLNANNTYSSISNNDGTLTLRFYDKKKYRMVYIYPRFVDIQKGSKHCLICKYIFKKRELYYIYRDNVLSTKPIVVSETPPQFIDRKIIIATETTDNEESKKWIIYNLDENRLFRHVDWLIEKNIIIQNNYIFLKEENNTWRIFSAIDGIERYPGWNKIRIHSTEDIFHIYSEGGGGIIQEHHIDEIENSQELFFARLLKE